MLALIAIAVTLGSGRQKNNHNNTLFSPHNMQHTKPPPDKPTLVKKKKEKRKRTNVRQSDVNLSLLALPCSRIFLMQGGVYYLPWGGWVHFCKNI